MCLILDTAQPFDMKLTSPALHDDCCAEREPTGGSAHVDS